MFYYSPMISPVNPQSSLQVPVTLANRAALAAQLHHRDPSARIVLSGADVSGVGSSEAQARTKDVKVGVLIYNTYIYICNYHMYV